MKSADVIIVGTGVAGLFCALNLPQNLNILMITKDSIDKSDSYLAQGGICVLKDESDYESFLMDTLKAGHFENSISSVNQMIRKSPEVIKDLIAYGVEFERKDGRLSFTKEGAHSAARILYHKDITGKEITSKLLKQVQLRENIKVCEYTEMIDLVCSHNICTGVVTRNEKGSISRLDSNYVILATGGIGGLYKDTTNYSHLTGDSIAIAIKHKLALRDINYIQIHPTTLYSTRPGRRFLISESVRGEGAYLYNSHMERFVDELLPRDLLTKEINKQMELEGSKHVWLSLKHLGTDRVKERFPNIYQECYREGIDITRDCIPVLPAQHYYMGGIKVNLCSKTSMEHLYAVGETSCNGVHGANRLASNSLLESLVFAKEAAHHIANTYIEVKGKAPFLNLNIYKNYDQLKEKYKNIIVDEIERVNKNVQSSNNQIKCG